MGIAQSTIGPQRPLSSGVRLTDFHEHTVRQIIELANRGMFAEALHYYQPEARLFPGNAAVSGGYRGSTGISELIQVAIKQFGAPRVVIDAINVVGTKVYVETGTQPTGPPGQGPQSREVHIFEFSEGKVARHRIYTDAVPPERFTATEE